MRTMVRVSLPVERGNQRIVDGTLARIIQEVLGELKPEAAYFLPFEGKRTALIFLDVADASQIPAIAEPFFLAFNAEVDFYPVMNAEDLAKGLQASAEATQKYG